LIDHRADAILNGKKGWKQQAEATLNAGMDFGLVSLLALGLHYFLSACLVVWSPVMMNPPVPLANAVTSSAKQRIGPRQRLTDGVTSLLAVIQAPPRSVRSQI